MKCVSLSVLVVAVAASFVVPVAIADRPWCPPGLETGDYCEPPPPPPRHHHHPHHGYNGRDARASSGGVRSHKLSS